MSKIKSYFQESWLEVRDNVTWTPMSELVNTTVMVLVASLVFAFAIMAIDTTFSRVMQLLYSL